MIVKIGGTNGSGKTTLVREIMKRWRFYPGVLIKNAKPVEYWADVKVRDPLSEWFKRIVVLGDYRNVCGGMDAIGDNELRLSLVEQYLKKKDTLVFYEGVLTGVTYGAMGEMSDRPKGVPWLYTFMNTPYEVCVERVVARRKAKGNLTPFDGMKSLHPKIRACQSVATKAEAAGHAVHWVEVGKSDVQIKALFKRIEEVMSNGR